MTDIAHPLSGTASGRPPPRWRSPGSSVAPVTADQLARAVPVPRTPYWDGAG